jgi:hypothetical protein
MSNTTAIDKIRHLLLLAEKAETEAEAANASYHAQAMMSKYRISLVDVKNDPTSAACADEVIKDNDGPESGQKIAQWKTLLLNTICTQNGCRVLIQSKDLGYQNNSYRRARIQCLNVIGTEADAVLCCAFYVSIRDVIEHLALVYKPGNMDRGEGKNWATSFKLGCTSTICERLRQANCEAKQQAVADNAITALAIIDNRDKNVVAYIGKIKSKTKHISVNNVNGDAYRTGQDVGKNVSLTNKVLKN